MKYFDLDQLIFLLFNVHKIEEILQNPKFNDFDKESVIMFLNSIKDLSDKELYPYLRDFDLKPAKFAEGAIKIHPQFEHIFPKIFETGIIGAHFSPKHGGMNMPHLVIGAAEHIMYSANNHVPSYISLTVGSANLITSFGNQEQIDTYVPNMLANKWMGTMCLTEPEAGSAVGNLRTVATKTQDGNFLIKGQKIFISGGDHQFAENFIHLVLARIQGAPSGTKGISLFIVPKYRLGEDGSLIYNDVATAGDYQKMGQRGYSTAHLMFGEKDDCHGYLVGQSENGMKYMFQMMNQARLEVGLGAASTAITSYFHALEYSHERVQGPRLTDDGQISDIQTNIINHADIRRMLFFQRSVGFGALSLIIEAFKLVDKIEITEGEEKENLKLLLDLITPVAKAYPSEYGLLAANQGVQVLGGYGFTIDFILEQLSRDIRITSIYEGTTGIQSMDLLGRKITAKNGKSMMLLLDIINDTLSQAKKYAILASYVNAMNDAIKCIQSTMEYLLPLVFQQKIETYMKDANLFLEMFSHILISWQWLKISIESIESNDNTNRKLLYDSNIRTMEYYFNYELPKIYSLKEILTKPQTITLQAGEDLLI